jgi:hypothetical protein
VRYCCFFSFDDDLLEVLPVVVHPKVVQIGKDIRKQDEWSKWNEYVDIHELFIASLEAAESR